ncbi:MAG: putative sulfate exporter family transporter [Gemmatimonadota bacterium]|nr:putative sulfate exporter family transporter [Gemmatimonadota bacterium]
MPGLVLTLLVAFGAQSVARIEEIAFGHPIIEALVVAIVLGTIVRTVWTPPEAYEPGIQFAAKEILEVAVFLLGAAVDVELLRRAGVSLVLGIVLLVVLGIASGWMIGRAFGLPRKLAVLLACGNAICGNSAIAAIAPVIGAEREHVASAIAFTAILGVAVVLGLPMLIAPLHLSHYQYGVVAGLTVYAVPQVLAAAFPVSAISGQVGTLVKLVRVLMLGPVVVFFALRRHDGHSGETVRSVPLSRIVPWFLAGFLLLAALRSAGLIPGVLVNPARLLSGWLTVLAMAALGLGVDLKAVRRVGAPVVATVSCSLVILLVLSVILIRSLEIA